jgi:hypothetical protein
VKCLALQRASRARRIADIGAAAGAPALVVEHDGVTGEHDASQAALGGDGAAADAATMRL